MNVGVDARTLVGNRSGVGNYLLNVIESGAFDGDTVFAYYDTPVESLPEIDVPEGTELRPRLVESPDPVGRLFGPAEPLWWVNVTLLRALNRDGVDAFFGPNFVQPALFDGPSAIVVHDVIHRTMPEVHTTAYRLYLRASLASSVRGADHVITVSEHSKRDFLQYHDLPPERVSVAYGAADEIYRPREIADETRLRLRREFDLPDRFVLYVGNIEPRKNIATVIDALAQCADENRPPLVVVGKEQLAYELLEETLEGCPFREEIRFTGYVPDEDLPLLYNMASVFVFPSLYEGFGLPVLEAMQSGTPVVTSNTTSIPEVVGNGGLTVDPHDTDGLATAILTLWTDQTTRVAYRDRALKQAKSFSWTETASEISTVFDRLGGSSEQ